MAVTDVEISSDKSQPALASYLPESQLFLKRILDVCVTILLLLVISPVFLTIGMAVFASDRKAIFYVHRRIGRRGRTFGCVKFRTMRVDAEAALAHLLEHDAQARQEWAATRKLKNDPRVTRVGAMLRKTSLDELPQLINVLRGDMSLVGPRPVVFDELQKHYHGPAMEIYHSVRPGITGLWQVSGRSDTNYSYRVARDCHYVNNLSIPGDFLLLARTVKAVIVRNGAY